MSEEPLREPEPERLSELDLRLRQRDRRTPWVRIVILALALVAILVFYQSIGEGMAGCFGKFVQPKAGETAAPPTTPGTPAPEMNLRIEPARPLPLPDAG